MRLLLPLLFVAPIGACAVDAEPVDECTGDRCDSAGSREELLAALEGFHDPVAELLRATATERGTLTGDYRVVLDGVGTSLGCDDTTETSFVVLSNDGFMPKPIITRCGGDANAASQFFVAMVGSEAGLDPRATHLAAWDADSGMYRRYATAPAGDGEMAINVSPDFCLGCHAGPEKLATWAPIMNEMTSPWAGWNAEPGFASVLFDEFLDPAFAADPTYQVVLRDGVLDSAAGLEPVVRAGISRVTSTRLKERATAADATRALELLRPLFCDESTNYVSEVHDSGELRTHALVDDAFRSLYRTLDVDGGWGWLADTRIRLVAPTAGEAPVTLVPVRGEATVQLELGLVARGALDPLAALRVRALDWKHPVQSAFRCNLYRTAADRIGAGALAGAPAATTEELLPLVFAEIMTIPVGAERVSLASGSLLQIADAATPATIEALRTGSLAGFATTPTELGATLETYVAGFQAAGMRPVLSVERNRRACLAVSQNPTAPIYPDLECS